MRLIDADALITLIREEKIKGETLGIIKALGSRLQAETLNQACDRHIKMINSLPIIEFTHCKDCIHKDVPCPLSGGSQFFCAYGAKEEE